MGLYIEVCWLSDVGNATIIIRRSSGVDIYSPYFFNLSKLKLGYVPGSNSHGDWCDISA
jgi:hypothetical protein